MYNFYGPLRTASHRENAATSCELCGACAEIRDISLKSYLLISLRLPTYTKGKGPDVAPFREP